METYQQLFDPLLVPSYVGLELWQNSAQYFHQNSKELRNFCILFLFEAHLNECI